MKITALQKFVADYPKSKDRITALELLVSTRAQLADEKLKTGENELAIQLYKDAVTDAPTPISEQVFADVILGIPTKLFYVNQQSAAVEIAKIIEAKVSDNAKQLVAIATFYIGTEKSAEAKRIVEKAIALDPTLPVAYQTLGVANRLNFDLADSANSYAKALELDPNSIVSKRNLAEMKRAIGKSDEAVALYRELVERDANDISANNGLILSLFDAGKQGEAEVEMSKSLETKSNNLFLIVGAAYWYASQNNGDKAVEFANKAIEIEPRYVWGRIALARGLMLKNQPFEAEKVLIIANQYGSFPTLDYELATVRFQAGFFEEANTELKRRFYVKDNYVQTYIAGRVAKEAETFTELLGLERQASIFIPKAADNAETSEKIKALLDFNLKLAAKNTTEDELNKAVDEFVKGDDKMKTHRQLYVANRLLDAKKNLAKVLEVTQNAVKGVDNSLEITYPAAAVLAEELLPSRTLAISKGEQVIIPTVPRPTLSKILRGRIEELAGWTLYEQNKLPEAITRFKRAISILPEKSSYWRSSLWRLGKAQDVSGNPKDALENYIKSYNDDIPNQFRRATIENAYRKVKGNTDGLDELIGTNPFAQTVAQVTETPAVSPTPAADTTPNPTPEIEATATPTPEPTPEIKAEVSPTPSASPQIKVEVTPTPQPTVEPTPTPEVKVSETPIATPETTPIQTPEIKVETVATSSPIPTPETIVEPSPTPEIKAETTVTTSPTPKNIFEPIIITVPKTDNSKTTKEPEKTAEPKEIEPKETPQSKEPETKETPQIKETEQVAENTNKPKDSMSRPRVIVEKTDETTPVEMPSCLVSSQENLSILSNGGNLGVLVGYVGDGDTSKIEAASSSPTNIVVNFEPGIGRQSNRSFFVIKSISDNKGTFMVTFTSPCGKKEIQVRVR